MLQGFVTTQHKTGKPHHLGFKIIKISWLATTPSWTLMAAIHIMETMSFSNGRVLRFCPGNFDSVNGSDWCRGKLILICWLPSMWIWMLAVRQRTIQVSFKLWCTRTLLNSWKLYLITVCFHSLHPNQHACPFEGKKRMTSTFQVVVKQKGRSN